MSERTILNQIYNNREEELYETSEEEKIELEEILAQRDSNNKKLELALNKIKEVTSISIDDIEKYIQKKMNIEYKINAYTNEKFYKARI